MHTRFNKFNECKYDSSVLCFDGWLQILNLWSETSLAVTVRRGVILIFVHTFDEEEAVEVTSWVFFYGIWFILQ